MTAVAVWNQRPRADDLLKDRLARGWSPTASRLRAGDRVLGHAACAVTREPRTVPVFGDPGPHFPAVIRPSAYGVIVDEHGRLAIVRTPMGAYLPGGGQADAERPEDTVVREVREECGLVVRVGAWRRVAIEHVSSAAEQTHFEKHNTFCDAAVTGSADDAVDTDHELMWVSTHRAIEVLRPESHRWVIGEWLRARDASSYDER